MAEASLSSKIVHGLFITEGALTFLGNLLLISLILSLKRLRRKELLIIGGLAFGDLLYGVGYFFGGIRRLKLSLLGTHLDLIPPWECMKAVQSVFFVAGSQAAALMLVAVSFDRLLAVRWYAFYMKLNNRYAKTVLAALFGYVFLTTAAMALLSYFATGSSKGVVAICISTQVGPSWLGFYQPMIQMGCGVISVLLFLVTFYFYRKHVSQVQSRQMESTSRGAASNASSAAFLRQQKMTRVVGITVLITLITYVIPHGTVLLLNTVGFGKGLTSLISPYLWVISGVNSITNIVVLAVGHTDVQTCLKAVLQCKNPKVFYTSEVTRTRKQTQTRGQPSQHTVGAVKTRMSRISRKKADTPKSPVPIDQS